MIKVSDYIVKRLEEYGVKQAFMISGGGAMHLNDSFGKSEKIEYLCNHHEQASAMAAEGYARVSGKLPVVVVTSGPGGTNALTGVIGQWLDSVPCLYISGQVKQETVGAGSRGQGQGAGEAGSRGKGQGAGLRQLGDQEINIIDMVRPVTKFAETLINPHRTDLVLDRAIESATQGRPGPVWIDIPLDVQSAMIDENLTGEGGYLIPLLDDRDQIKETMHALTCASRPLVIAGHGIRIAKAEREFMEFVERFDIPVVTSFNGMDLMPTDHPLFAGRIGTIGTYAGNRALRECDLLISIGTRNNIRQVSYDWQAFAPQAKKIVVDIDAAELDKPTLKPDIAVHADAGEFIKAVQSSEFKVQSEWKEWREECSRSVDGETRTRPGNEIEPYDFIRTLTGMLPEDSIIISGNGTASVCLHQAGIVKKGQRVIMNSGCAAMGYDLPAAIGACLANDRKPVVCITGDGSIQMNIQELQTIAHHRLPIKIFVLNNGGYHSIRQTQDNYFEGRHVGAGRDSGMSCPDITAVAEAYDLQSGLVVCHKGMDKMLRAIILSVPGPIVCSVKLTQDYVFDKQNLAEACHAV
jgi:acetolactate synthase-1/2/3 large subunit